MASKRQNQGRDKRSGGAKTGGKSTKTRPERVSGISAAAIKGAEQAELSDNAEKMARPGPGMTAPRADRRTAGSMESGPTDSSAASAERLSEEEERQWRLSEDASPDDFDEGEADVER